MTTARNACVIGWPAAHSRSPLIHNYWIKQHRLGGEYRREEVPAEKFADFVRELAAHGYAGANVTIPHKEQALALSSHPTYGLASGLFTTDLSLFKNFQVTEGVRFELRFEAFNVTNSPEFSNPSSTFGTASFGNITGTSIDNRDLQLGAKLVW